MIVRVRDKVRASVNVSIRGQGEGVRLGLVYDCMVVEHPVIHMYAYAYECRSHTTPPSTSKVQRRQCSVVRQTLRQLPGSVIADLVACTPQARALTAWVNCSSSVWE